MHDNDPEVCASLSSLRIDYWTENRYWSSKKIATSEVYNTRLPLPMRMLQDGTNTWPVFLKPLSRCARDQTLLKVCCSPKNVSHLGRSIFWNTQRITVQNRRIPSHTPFERRWRWYIFNHGILLTWRSFRTALGRRGQRRWITWLATRRGSREEEEEVRGCC